MNTRKRRINLDSLLALGLILFVVAACTRTKKTTPTNTSDTNVSESSSTDQMAAETLFQEYQKDKDAADRKYKGQILTVTGTVDKVKIGPSGNPYVLMKTSSLILRVQFLFKKSDESAVNQLKEGQKATIRGRVHGRIGNVLLQDCEIL